MRVEAKDNSMMVVPETSFERNFLENYFGHSAKMEVFLKSGLTASDTIGLKIRNIGDLDKLA